MTDQPRLGKDFPHEKPRERGDDPPVDYYYDDSTGYQIYQDDDDDDEQDEEPSKNSEPVQSAVLDN